MPPSPLLLRCFTVLKCFELDEHSKTDPTIKDAKTEGSIVTSAQFGATFHDTIFTFHQKYRGKSHFKEDVRDI